MSADVTLPADTARPARPRTATFGLSWRILGLVIVAVMTAEVAIFLPSIARFRLVYLEQLIESGTLAALALDATPDNMVTEQVKGSLLAHARVEAVVLVEPNKPKRALMNVEPRPEMLGFNLKDRGALGLIWDALQAMARNGSHFIRVGGESMRLPGAMVWIVVDEAPMRAAMYGYASRILVLSIIIALFTAALLALALRWLVIRPLQDLSRAMIDSRRAPEEGGTVRAPVRRNDEIGVVDREFQLLQRELRTSLRQKTRLAEVGAATNKINHDLRNLLANTQLLSDRLTSSPDPTVQRFAPKLIASLDRAIAFCNDTLQFGRAAEQPPRRELFALRELVEEVADGLGLPREGVVEWQADVADDVRIDADRDQLFRVLTNLVRNAMQAIESHGEGARGRVAVAAFRDGPFVRLQVSDDGPGVPARARAHLFQAFQGSVRKGGTGLGLAIVKKIVEEHGGLVTLENNDGPGACATIRLPLDGKDSPAEAIDNRRAV